jgi:hypothetical protein
MSTPVIADIKIPQEFRGYKDSSKILRDRSLPQGRPIRFIEYDIDGDGKPDVKEEYPMKYIGIWKSSLEPTSYFFDTNGNNIFEEDERILDMDAYLKWMGYTSEEKA